MDRKKVSVLVSDRVRVSETERVNRKVTVHSLCLLTLCQVPGKGRGKIGQIWTNPVLNCPETAAERAFEGGGIKNMDSILHKLSRTVQCFATGIATQINSNF